MKVISSIIIFLFIVHSVNGNIFLLYDVFQSEGFNLRRDVYMRIVNVVRLLREPSKLPSGLGVKFPRSNAKGLNWTLVLPPWGPLPHWFAASDRLASVSENSWQQFVGLPWSNFFDLDSLGQVVPVIEFEEFHQILVNSHTQSNGHLPKINLALNLVRQYEIVSHEKQRGVHFCPPHVRNSHKAAKNQGYISLFQARLMTDQTELVSSTAAHYECITGDLEAVYLAPFLHQLVQNKSFFPDDVPIKSIFLSSAEAVIHGHWSEWSQEYWTVRRSMVFTSHLRQIGDEFRISHLASEDQTDRTVMPSPIPSKSNGSAWLRTPWPLAPALGGPYLAVHWRCGDFVSNAAGRWNYTPSPSLAAKQIGEALRREKLDVVYLATDASETEVEELEAELAPASVVRFVPSESDWIRLGPGGIAIVDQWICAHARFFLGTSPSTFTFRITEERTIMGFSPESTFNTLCANGEARYYTSNQQANEDKAGCEALTYWPIKLESGYTAPSSDKDQDTSVKDEL